MQDYKRFLESELNWLSTILDVTKSLNAKEECAFSSVFEVKPPDATSFEAPYAKWVIAHKLSFEERFLVILALVPHTRPDLLDTFKVAPQPPTAFGGIIGNNSRIFIPTGETFLFILGGTDVQLRVDLMRLFHLTHFFKKTNIIWLEKDSRHEPEMSGVISLASEYLDLFIYGIIRKPDFSLEFPAKLITTEMEWDDLVLRSKTKKELQEIEYWLESFPKLMEDDIFRRRNKPGLRVLFEGPPGTGKTLSAALIGKKTGRDVYRVDLSAIVSKYIGETEKNLSKLFDRAENKDWILFFDEADALFGKRTGVSDSNDRYANQEVSYLLQRVEYYAGMVVLASNMKQNIDQAFLRRFQSIVSFVRPDAAERIKIWNSSHPRELKLENADEMNSIIAKYDLSGAHISNISMYCCLQAARSDNFTINKEMLIKAISRELQKEDRTM